MKNVDIAIPIYYGNIPQIEDSLKKQVEFYNKNLHKYNWKIILAINGPDKGILNFANIMVKKFKNVSYTYTPIPGKGIGIKNCWNQSDADIISYMDVDLSTEIEKFPELLRAVEGEYDLALGSKYLPNSKILRSAKERDFVSKVYHTFFTHFLLNIKTNDVHCGFKALKRDSFRKIIPFLKDNQWFFDTELMYFATRNHFKIKEIPIIWSDSDIPSGVKIYKTIPKFILKIIGLKFKSFIGKY